MKKRALAVLLAAALSVGLLPMAAAAGQTFSDVPSSYWGYADIEAVAEAGLMNGTGDDAFSPEMKVSVAQFLTLLGRLVFPDVKADGADWYGPYVRAAEDAGLLTGSQVDTDHVEAEINRYDMAAILRAAAKKLGVTEKKAQSSEVKDYLDVPTRYADAVLAVYGMGLIKGDGAGNFNGGNTMTRAEVATVIMRLAKAKPGGADPEPETIEPDPPAPPAVGGSSTGTGTGSQTAKPDPEGARRTIIQSLNNMEERIELASYHIPFDEIGATMEVILGADLDRYFVYSYVTIGSPNGETEWISVHYYGTKEEYDEYKREMKMAKGKAAEIVAATVTADMSDYEIAKALHDYLALNVEYDYNWMAGIYSPNPKHRPYKSLLYSTLIKHLATCGGYTYAYKYMMDLAGVPCEEIDGNADGTDEIAAALGYRWGVGHSWNIVQIDGEWYHVDVTWDDLGGDNIRYDYFLKSDKAMEGHYDWEASHACTSTKYDDMTGTENDQKEAEREEKREAEIMADFMARFNTLPYRSAEGLTETEELSDEELLSYTEDKVYYPMDQYTYDDMVEIYSVVVNNDDEKVFQLNEQFWDSSCEDGQWYLSVYRFDIHEEYYRRHPEFRPQS